MPAPTRRLARTTVATVLVALVAALLAVLPAAPAGAATEEARFVALVNAERAKQGLHPLRVADDLTEVARRWSRTMADAEDIWHNPKLREQSGDWKSLGENVGMGPRDVAQLHQAFLRSPEHRRNILDAGYTEIGVGTVVAGGKLYVTQIYRHLRGATVPPAPEPDPKPKPKPEPEPDPTTPPRPTATPTPTDEPAPAPTRPRPGAAPSPADVPQIAAPATDAVAVRLAALYAQAEPAADPVASAVGFVDTVRALAGEPAAAS